METDKLQIYYQQCQLELYLYLCTLTGSQTLAEYLLQKTFLKAFLPLTDQHGNIRTWFYNVKQFLYKKMKNKG